MEKKIIPGEAPALPFQPCTNTAAYNGRMYCRTHAFAVIASGAAARPRDGRWPEKTSGPRRPRFSREKTL